jgi:cytosine/adenosine deaminase-related metal-dependent hydrolase
MTSQGELSDAFIVVEDGVVAEVGTGAPPADRSGADHMDGRGLVGLPGLVNTHHHFFQTVTRALPAAQDVPLLVWESVNYPYWTRVDEEVIHVTAEVALAELMLSGCSTTSDHLYAFPRHTGGAVSMLAAEIDAADGLGIRLHATRGAIDISIGGRATEFVEDTDAVLASMEDAISQFHDPAPGAMCRVTLGPNGLTVCTERLMRACVELATTPGVGLHTHVAEIPNEQAYCAEQYGQTAIERLADLGWVTDNAWLAHAVHLDEREIALLGTAGTGVAHCPVSNMRLASGAAPILDMIEAGVPVGLGVDGSASNDSGNLLAEARAAMLVSRLREREQNRLMTARQVLHMATAGGAKALGRDDIGAIGPGMQADIALFRPSGVAAAGFENDPIAGLIFAATRRVESLMIKGRSVVREGQLVTGDEDLIAERHRAVVQRMVA